MKKVIVILLIVLFAAMAIIAKFAGVVHAAEADDLTASSIAAKSYVLVTENGDVLKAHNENERIPVASMVKTMTLLLTFEEIEKGNLNEEGTAIASQHAASMGGSQVFIEEGTEYKIKDLIKAVVVASGNDASVMLAETISGTEQDFVARMNERAKELGCTNTNFENPTGLPSSNSFSSAIDMAKIMCELKKHAKYFDYAQIWLDKIEHSAGRVTELANTNKLVRHYKYCIGGKTGSTNEAGFCVNAVARNNGLDLVAVVAGSSTSKERFAAATQLFNYGFANYESRAIISAGDTFAVCVENSRDNEILAVAKQNFNSVVKKGDKSGFDTAVSEVCVKAPVKKDDKVGEVVITKNGEVVGKVDLFAPNDVDEITFWGSLKEILEDIT